MFFISSINPDVELSEYKDHNGFLGGFRTVLPLYSFSSSYLLYHHRDPGTARYHQQAMLSFDEYLDALKVYRSCCCSTHYDLYVEIIMLRNKCHVRD